MENVIPLGERIAQLREENEQLREAARVFGELAERLMRQLETERRRSAAMRTVSPTTRRVPQSVA